MSDCILLIFEASFDAGLSFVKIPTSSKYYDLALQAHSLYLNNNDHQYPDDVINFVSDLSILLSVDENSLKYLNDESIVELKNYIYNVEDNLSVKRIVQCGFLA